MERFQKTMLLYRGEVRVCALGETPSFAKMVYFYGVKSFKKTLLLRPLCPIVVRTGEYPWILGVRGGVVLGGKRRHWLEANATH